MAMESSLKRVVDYKVIFDILADSNGMVHLQVLQSLWPSDLAASAKLPRGCAKFWSELADREGYLDWERFSGGLEKALKADSFRLSKWKGTPSEAEQRLKALRKTELKIPSHVKAEDIEGLLISCGPEGLVRALARTRKEVYNAQRSLHTLASPATSIPRKSTTPQVRRWSSMGSAVQVRHQSMEPERTGSGASELSKHLSLRHEKEELLKGLEVLQKTQQYFSDKLEQVTLEEKEVAAGRYSEQMRAEELLAVLEQGGQENETVNHLREINAHVTSLILEAPELRQETPTTAGPQSGSHQHQTRSYPSLPTHGHQYHPPRTTQGYPVTSPHGPRVPTGMVPPPQTTRRSPLRSSSMSEVRSQQVPSDPPPSSRRKSRRFLSLKGGTESTDRPYYPPSPQYPLRETFSMQGLPSQSTLSHSDYPTSHPPFRGRAASMTIPTYPHSPSSPTHHRSPQHTSTVHGDLSASYPPPHSHRTEPRPTQPTASYPPPHSHRTEPRPTQPTVTRQENDRAEGGKKHSQNKRKMSKTVREQLARIQQLQTEKALLVQQMFKQKAATSTARDDSILSIL